MEPWYRVALPRNEVREGRSFNPDEFAIALERVVAGAGPDDYRDPEKFLARTSFTRALREHSGLVLRRLSGETQNSAPVMTLITQFGGGKTHTLTLLYHLTKHGKKIAKHPDVVSLVTSAGLSALPDAKPAVFVGNAWDPQEGRENPWIDIARQVAGNAGVALLGKQAKSTPPGTEALGNLIDAAGTGVLFLFDEVLNCLNRHRDLADPFYAFIQNLTVAVTGTTKAAAMISLPRSPVEMTQWDQQWQDKITRVVRRVAKDLIANDESEISEVIRKRLFEDIGKESVRRGVAKAYADWCFERRNQLPPEWIAVDSAASEAKARDFLRDRFEICYPFHPATLTVFQRKWQSLPQFQQTRGTLAMLAQWISWAYRDGYQRARREPLITLGSAPLDVQEFCAAVLGQLGESRLGAAIGADIAGANSHARALDADTTGPLRDIHRRVGAAVLFESSGGMTDKVAHLPDLRFALGEPELDTTSIDNAVVALQRRGYYLRKVGTDGFKFGFTATLTKVVQDRKASLDEEEVRRSAEALVKREFEKGAPVPVVAPTDDGAEVVDSTRLTIVVLHPRHEWDAAGRLRATVADWTRQRGKSPRLYPGSLVWVVRKPGRELQEKVETWLAWKRVERELTDGTLGGDFERSDRAAVAAEVRTAEDDARDEVWASYRYVILADRSQDDGVEVIDLGAGHASASESLAGRIVAALRSNSLLNESPGAGYLDRKWPPAFKESGAWPLASLRQAFLSGAMERVLDVDAYLKAKVPGFVQRGDFGLASGADPAGGYQRVWFGEAVSPDEIAFDGDVYLLTKARAKVLKAKGAQQEPDTKKPDKPEPPPVDVDTPKPVVAAGVRTIRVSGEVPFESWNRLGARLIPKLRSGQSLRLTLDAVAEVDARAAAPLAADIRQVLGDLGLTEKLKVDE